MNSFTFGIIAEYIAILYYRLQFYKILHHRKREMHGEIDIIATRGNQIVFIEVKGRKDGINHDILHHTQIQRITKSAELFLYQNIKYQSYDARFDLVIIQPYKYPVVICNAW